MEDKYIEREPEKIQCIHCDKYFDDDDDRLIKIFDECLCDDCIDYLLKNNVSYLRNLIKPLHPNNVTKYDLDYLLERLDKINKESKK